MKKKWIPTDGWRGYYQPVPPENFELLVDCQVVNDAGGQLGRILIEWLRGRKIKYRSGFLRTSNIFSANYYVIVEKGKLDKDLKRQIDNWFVDQNCNTFSIFTGESRELDIEKAKEEFDLIVNSGEVSPAKE